MQTAKEITHTLQNQREITFDLHLLLPPGQERIKQPQPLAHRVVLGVDQRGGGMVTGQIEPCIR